MGNIRTNTTPRRMPLVALLSANAVSTTGSAMAGVAVPWFVLETTGSAAKTGLAFAAATLGSFLSGFLGGPVVDGLGLKRSSVLTDLLSAAAVALVPLLYFTVGLAYWQLLLLVFAAECVDTPGAAARQGMLGDLAGAAKVREEKANAVAQGVRQLSNALGPPIAGALVAFIGAAGVLWLDAASFVLSAAVVGLFVSAAVVGAASVTPEGEQAEDSPSGPSGYLAELSEGLRFLRNESLVFRITASSTVFQFFFGPLLGVVLAVYAKQTYGDAASLGLLAGAWGAGALVGFSLFAALGHRLPRKVALICGLLGMSLPLFALVLTPPLIFGVAALALAGLSSGPLNPLIFTLIRERTPERLLGRVFGAVFALSSAAIPLGAALAGWALEAVGLRPVLATIPLGMLAACLWLVLSIILRQDLELRTRIPTTEDESSEGPTLGH